MTVPAIIMFALTVCKGIKLSSRLIRCFWCPGCLRSSLSKSVWTHGKISSRAACTIPLWASPAMHFLLHKTACRKLPKNTSKKRCISTYTKSWTTPEKKAFILPAWAKRGRAFSSASWERPLMEIHQFSPLSCRLDGRRYEWISIGGESSIGLWSLKDVIPFREFDLHSV